MNVTARLKISLFGRPCFHLEEREVETLVSSKMLELICYILIHRDRPHPREVLGSLLWGDTSSVKSKKYLRQILWQLRAVLSLGDGASRTDLLDIDPEWVQVNRQADYWLDVEQFESAFHQTRSQNGRSLSIAEADLLRGAVDLYQGDLLEGWYQDWCLFERERLQNMYFEMLEKLMDFCEAWQQHEDGLIYGTRILQVDPIRERTQRRIMRLYYAAGKRTEALRQYDRFAAALKDELGVAPSQLTLQLVDQIRQDRLELSSPTAGINSRPVDNFDSEPQALNLEDLLIHLNQLAIVLSQFQRRIRKNIQAVERTIKIQQ